MCYRDWNVHLCDMIFRQLRTCSFGWFLLRLWEKNRKNYLAFWLNLNFELIHQNLVWKGYVHICRTFINTIQVIILTANFSGTTAMVHIIVLRYTRPISISKIFWTFNVCAYYFGGFVILLRTAARSFTAWHYVSFNIITYVECFPFQITLVIWVCCEIRALKSVNIFKNQLIDFYRAHCYRKCLFHNRYTVEYLSCITLIYTRYNGKH